MSNRFNAVDAVREKLKVQIALAGVSGSGKTESALMLATGLLSPGGIIVAIDTENERTKYFADKYKFKFIKFEPPFTPEAYIEAIEYAESFAEVIIIDSLTHEWEGEGGLLESIAKSPSANKFQAWDKATPRQQKLIEKIKRCKCHLICTMRSKEDYQVITENGKTSIKKMGLKPIQREGVSYEFTVLINLDISHQATGDNDHTGIFPYGEWKEISVATGRQFKEWANSGVYIDRPVVQDSPAQDEPPAQVDSAPAEPPKAPAKAAPAKSKDTSAIGFMLTDFLRAHEKLGDEIYYKIIKQAFRESSNDIMYNAVMKGVKEDGLLHANMIPNPVREKTLQVMRELYKSIPQPPPASTEPPKEADPLFAQNSSDPAVAFENTLKDANLLGDFGWWMGDNGIESIKDLFTNKPGLVPIANEWYKEKSQKELS